MDAYVEIGLWVTGAIVVVATLMLPAVVLALRGASRTRADRDTFPIVGLIFVAVAAIYDMVASFMVVGASDTEWQEINIIVYIIAVAILSLVFALVTCRLFRIRYYSALVFLLPPSVEYALVFSGNRMLASHMLVPLSSICAVWIVALWVYRLRLSRQVEAT